MIHEANNGAPMSPMLRDRTRDEARPVQQPAEQEGIEGGDAGPEHEGTIADCDERHAATVTSSEVSARSRPSRAGSRSRRR